MTGPSRARVKNEWIRQALNFRAGYMKYPHCKIVTVETPNNQRSDAWNILRNQRAATIRPKRAFVLRTVVWTVEEEAGDESTLMDQTGKGLGRGFLCSLMKDDRIAIMARAQVSVCITIFFSLIS